MAIELGPRVDISSANLARSVSLREPTFAHPSVESFERSLVAKDANNYRGETGLYPRNGSAGLAELEDQFSYLSGVDKDRLIATNSGMSAVVTAIEIASPTAGDRVVVGSQGYLQTLSYVKEDLRDRGVEASLVNYGSHEYLEEAIQTDSPPKLAIIETINNGPLMWVVDVERLLSLPAIQEGQTQLILDNTLPTDSHIPLGRMLKEYQAQYPDAKVTVVESATKSYAFNQELGGMAYTYNDELLQAMRKKRRRIGTVMNQSVVETIERVIPPTKEQFDRENRIITRNTLELAKAASRAKGVGDIFTVTHPNLPDHDGYEYASEHYPDGATPVFYINRAWWSNITPRDIALALENAGFFVVEEAYLAESFAFDKMGVSYTDFYVRIAGGLEGEEKIAEQQERFFEALSSLAA